MLIMKRSLFLFLPFLAWIRKSEAATMEGVAGGDLMGFLGGEWAFVENRNGVSVIRHKEVTIASVATPLYFRGGSNAAFSPNGRFFAIICSKKEKESVKSGGMKFTSYRTASVHVYGREEGIWSLISELPFHQFPEGYKFLIEMGAVSDDGVKVLLKCGIVHPFKEQFIIMHEWETWTTAGQKVGEGLSV
jgi:hypothetical protein